MSSPIKMNAKGELMHEIVGELIDWIVRHAIDGFGPFVSAEQLATEYAEKHQDVEKAIAAMVQAEIVKVGVSGFLMGLPGLVAMPVSIPANLGADYLLAARLVAAIASLRGWDLNNDKVRSFIVLCLIGNQGKEIIKNASVVAGAKVAKNVVAMVSRKGLGAAERTVTTALLRVVGARGARVLGRGIPFLGSAVGASLDCSFIYVCARAAKETFVFQKRAGRGERA